MQQRKMYARRTNDFKDGKQDVKKRDRQSCRWSLNSIKTAKRSIQRSGLYEKTFYSIKWINMPRTQHTAKEIKANINQYDEENDINELKRKLKYKRERLKAVWEKVDWWWREYDRLLIEINQICDRIRELEF